MPRPAVLVMAKAPRAGAVKTRLEPLLGAEDCARLQAALITAAAEWAHAAAGADVFVAVDPPGAHEQVSPLVPAGTELLDQRGEHLGERLVAATADAFERGAGHLLTIGTDMPTLGPAHSQAALSDLAAGTDAVFGPALDGGYYLVGLAQPRPELFDLPAEVWGGPDVLARTLGIVRDRGLELGLLRAERDLDTPDDARAALLEPALPDDIAALLRAAAAPA